MIATTLMQPLQRRHIVVLVLIPVIMAAINSNWLYTPIGYLDPWYNVGYFLHYGDGAFRPGLYKISRLSWLLPGWVLYHALQPIVANFVLHVGALLVATVFVYLTLVRLVARDLALLAAVFLTIYFPFHGSGGWDYQNAGSGAYYALTLYCLTRAAQSDRPVPGLFAAGMTFAATFHANIVFANMVPVLAGHYLVAARSMQRPLTLGLVLRAMGWTLAGFAGLTVVLCLINWSVGREFLFFQPMLAKVFSFVEDPSYQKAWWSAWSTGWVFWPVPPWSTGAYYLAVPMATMLVCCWMPLRTFLRTSYDSTNLVPLFLIAQFVLLGAIWILWQSLGQTALEPEYFAYPLIIPCVVGLAGIMAMGEQPARAPANRALVPACLLLALVPGADLLGHLLSPAALPALNRLGSVALFFVVALLLVTAMARARSRPLLAVAMMSIFQAYYLPLTGFQPFYRAADNCAISPMAFEALIAIDRFVGEVTRPEHTWLWLGPQEVASSPLGCAFDVGYLRYSAASLSLNTWGSAMDTSASQITDEQIARLRPGESVAMVTIDPSRVGELVERLRRAGRQPGSIQQREVTVGYAHLFLQLLPVTQ